MMSILRQTLTGLLLLSFGVGPVFAADWTQFRGPQSAGIADEHNYATTWSPKENVVWRVELPGPGASSPITLGDKVFVTCYLGVGKGSSNTNDLERVLVCLSRTEGAILWQSRIHGVDREDAYRGFLDGHGYATSTPATDGVRVYVFFGKAGVLAFDLDGNQIWQTSVGTGSAMNGWGQGTSVILTKDTVIVPAFAESHALVALDKATGRQVWKSPADGFEGCWSSPILVDLPDGKQELVVSVPYELWGFDPANGDFLWNADGIKERVLCPTMVSQNGIVYAIGGQRGGAIALRAGGRGDVTKTHTVWQKDFGSYVTSPVLYGDHLYWVGDRGIAFCVKAADGEQVYRERLPDARQLYSSLVVANDRLFAVSRDNGTFVYPAKPQFEPAVQNSVDEDAGICNAIPAFSNGQMFLRTNKYMYCIARK